MDSIEVSFGRGDERGVPKMRIERRAADDRLTSVTYIRLSREEALRLHRELGVVLGESK